MSCIPALAFLLLLATGATVDAVADADTDADAKSKPKSRSKSKAKAVDTLAEGLGELESLFPKAVAAAHRYNALVAAHRSGEEPVMSLRHFLAACDSFDLDADDLDAVELGKYDGGQGTRYSCTQGSDRHLGDLVT